jgi:acyl-CoA-binding protein
MEDLERKFNKYISKVKKLEHISDNNKLYLYANYKQSIEGDINIAKPSIFSIVENEKWKAWNEIKGTSKENAMKNYIKKVKDLYK